MRKVIRVIGVLLLIAGIGFFSYPIVLRESFHRQARKAMEQLEDIRTEGSAAQEGEDMLYADLRSAMFAYNEALYLSGQRGLIDQLSYEEPDFHLSDYGINSQVLGTISIPAIDVELPIYNGASEENMTKGAAYLANTSLPVGGREYQLRDCCPYTLSRRSHVQADYGVAAGGRNLYYKFLGNAGIPGIRNKSH